MSRPAPLIPCIISGGSGTRLWPVSRQHMPKPFMRINEAHSLLQQTFLRALQLPEVERIVTVTNRELLFRTLDEYRALNCQQGIDLVLEPEGRNTAVAVTVAALHLQQHFSEDALFLVLPADHLISDCGAFIEAVSKARTLAEQGYLVTFGIQPSRAETGFGYIETGATLGAGSAVTRFIEKPDAERAQQLLDAGNVLWNSGMFCFPARLLLQQMQEHAPAVLQAARESFSASDCIENASLRQRELEPVSFAKAPDISIDYALMERSEQVAVVPCDPGWSDVGSWLSLREHYPEDEQGNQIQGEVITHNTTGCFIDSPYRVTGAVGLQDLIIVDTPDALLVADAASSQDVNKVVAELTRRQHDACRLHQTVHRPWGTYTVLEAGERFKIKRILVRAGQSLSLQIHHHRSEHWVVVSGMAKVENGERSFFLNTNESTYIPAGNRHRLSNPGLIDLVMIEVQSGEYLGEDDIVRLNDLYGRPADADRPEDEQ
ncbi:mannose-1-phosphate guanylyltransferase/mannose-6-phosphate isomerase [Neptuniibacter halophilus]|uniref:mannose-1-phosphate guanylyltransferase/mannose-6-phosphate isomerase n=1 Tax=Neptuniibacter halophilus TaxID=651666 RepID=UPI0025732BED|nr:mannose-1-phosphate guanylyltransferase/mannose-6-phosphate isomerase [Neptuniibacter halophilus]